MTKFIASNQPTLIKMNPTLATSINNRFLFYIIENIP